MNVIRVKYDNTKSAEYWLTQRGIRVMHLHHLDDPLLRVSNRVWRQQVEGSASMDSDDYWDQNFFIIDADLAFEFKLIFG